MEYSVTSDVAGGGYAKMIGGLVVGRTSNTEEALDAASPVGVITARTEGMHVEGVKFYNFDWNGAGGIQTCSHCWHDANTDSGARTVFVKDLYFDDTVPLRVRYSTPFRTIFKDESGGLTGLSANSWFVPYWPHLLQPECEDMSAWGGIICESTVTVRRIAFHGMPGNFFGMRLKITQLERDDEKSMAADETLQEYLDNDDNYSLVMYKQKLDPSNGWAMPYVTGKRYRLHWEAGLDFDEMKMEVSPLWDENDENTFLVFNFTQPREAVNFTKSYGSGD